jgi:hypothetical protein
MVDTDIIIWILRGKLEFKLNFDEAVKHSDSYIFITPIQIAEILAGMREKEKIETEEFLNSLNVVELNREIGNLAGRYINQYKKSYNVTLADALIAACTKLHNLQIWTLNKKHYPMFDEEQFYSPTGV